MLDNFIHVENMAGRSMQAGAYRIVPVSQSVRLNIPGLPGGLVWNRPVSVVVTTQDGQEQVLPIRDLTRIAQLTILGAAILGTLLFWRASRK
jgi:hypothetical protein